MSTAKKEKRFKGVDRKRIQREKAQTEKDIELRKKEGRYLTMQKKDEEETLVETNLLAPNGVLLYSSSGNIEIYLKLDIEGRVRDNYYIEEKINNKLTKKIKLSSIPRYDLKDYSHPIDLIFNKESYPYVFILFKDNVKGYRYDSYGYLLNKNEQYQEVENHSTSILMLNMEKYNVEGYNQYLDLSLSNETINFDPKANERHYLKDSRKNVLRLHNNGKLLMIQTHNRENNNYSYHLITILDNVVKIKEGKKGMKMMFYDSNLFSGWMGFDNVGWGHEFNNWKNPIKDYLVLGYNFLNINSYKDYPERELEDIETNDVESFDEEILSNYYELSDYNVKTGSHFSNFNLIIKYKEILESKLIRKIKDLKSKEKALNKAVGISDGSEEDSQEDSEEEMDGDDNKEEVQKDYKKNKLCEIIFGIIHIDNLGYYRVFKNIKLTFYELIGKGSKGDYTEWISIFLKKDLYDTIDIQEPLYSYKKTSIYPANWSQPPELKKPTNKSDAVLLDIGMTHNNRNNEIINYATRAYYYRLENINIESNFDDTIILFNPIFKKNEIGLEEKYIKGVNLNAKIDFINELNFSNQYIREYIYRIFQQVYSPKIVVTNIDNSITKIDYHYVDSRYFSFNYYHLSSNDNDEGIIEGSKILANWDQYTGTLDEDGCNISKNPGFLEKDNREKNYLDYLIVAGNYLINLKIKVKIKVDDGDNKNDNNMYILIFKKGIDKDGKGDIMFHQIKCYYMEVLPGWEGTINNFKMTEDLDLNLLFLKFTGEGWKVKDELYKLDLKTNIDMDTAFDELSDLYKMKEKGNFGKYENGSVFKFDQPKKEESIKLKKYTYKTIQGIDKRLSRQKKQIVEKSNAEMRAKENALRLKKGMLRNTEKEVAQLKKEKEEKIKKENALKDDIKKLRTRSPKGEIGKRTYMGKKIPQDKEELLSYKQILEKDNSRIKKAIIKLEKMKGTSTPDEDKINKLKKDIKDIESDVKFGERQIKYELDKVKSGKEPSETKFYVKWIKRGLPELNDMPTETNEDLMNFYERSLQVSSSKLRNLEYDIMDEEAKDEEERKKVIDKLKEQGEYLDSRIKEYNDKQLEDKMDFSEADPEGAKKYREKKKKEKEEAQEKKKQDSLEKKKAAAEVKKRRTQRKAAIKIQTQQRRYTAKKKLKSMKDERSYLNLLTQVTPLKSTPERAVEELENNLKLKKGIEERAAMKEMKKSKTKKKSEQIKKLKRTLKKTLKELESLQSDDSSSGSQSSSLSSVDSDKL